ncbi:defense protein l(2)34Fc-like [Branchiostoma lanceolatum]|uniref:defense protein l(2)34Fc-like n=1 Tax=Branchiostoma lanceolatum TaxID=7740 RepID=UPI0034548813
MLALVLLSLVVGSQAFHSGAPRQACSSGAPSHYPGQVQFTDMPYALTGGAYSPGQPMQLTLSGDRPFRGFQIKTSEGAFLNAPAGTQLFQCDNYADTITHSDSTDKTSVTFTYVPPTNAFGPINMRVTVVQSYDVYWRPKFFFLQENGDIITG